MSQAARDQIFHLLDRLIQEGWGHVPRHRIPENWRELTPPREMEILTAESFDRPRSKRTGRATKAGSNARLLQSLLRASPRAAFSNRACCLCEVEIRAGDLNYDRGYARRAHVKCVVDLMAREQAREQEQSRTTAA